MGTVELLWRHERPAAPRRGRPPKVGVDDLVAAGVAVADRTGGLDFGLREVAAEAGVAVMSLYSHVDNREQLVELMVDQCRRDMVHAGLTGSWQARLRQVAEENLALFGAHPWLAEWESEREVLGPGTLGKYERELGAVEPMDLDDVDKDAALSLVLDFTRASARALRSARLERAQESPEEWWQREGAALAAVGVADRYPLAHRVGAAAGADQQAAKDAERAHEFGLAVILDGLEARQRR